MEALARTTSAESSKSRTPSYTLSSASSPSASRKSRFADPDTSNGNVERASISMPPPASKSFPHQYTSRRPSKASDNGLTTGAVIQENVGLPRVTPGCAIDDLDVPTAESARTNAQTTPTLASLEGAPRSSKSDGDVESNRMSFSSLYSLGSLSLGSAFLGGNRAPAVSGPSSLAGSEPEVKSESHIYPTTATSSLSVTTSSYMSSAGLALSQSMLASNQLSPVLGSPHQQLSTSPHLHAMPGSSRQPPLPRGRAPNQRRISGSTGASSASPGAREMKEAPIGTIGICALDSKARSKPSRNILNRLISQGEFEVKIFGDKVILDEDVENWPVCDFLISFFSDGFPLEKAIAYSRMRKPFCVNDLPMQTLLWDRRLCLRILDKLKVPTPKRVEINRDGGPTLASPELAQLVFEKTGIKLDGPEDGTGGGLKPPKTIELRDDGETIVVDGVALKKPFVEKPVSGENHNINIYYSRSSGGGGRRLFRKINNKSSEKDDSLDVPRAITDPKSSYIYEQFLKVENAEDVKAYTVGPDYCHAETRKSPVVDGLVKRNPNGKEIRYVTSLTKEEAGMASRISEGFGQRVCGFDLLRTGEKSYVIDVNGWSFVKDNNDYYEKCAKILREMFVKEKQRREGKVQRNESDEQLQVIDRPMQSRKSTVSTSHRSQLKSILKSPSMSRLTGHHAHSRTPSAASPEIKSQTTPITSPPSFENSSGHRPPILTSRADRSLKAGVLPQPEFTSSEPVGLQDEAPPVPPPASKAQWKLKGMVSVIRHADRTPKQKFKFTFHTQPFIDLLKGHQEEVLLIGQAALASVSDAVTQALREGIEDPKKLIRLQNTLDKKGAYAGTKVQIKPMFRKKTEAELNGSAVESPEKERREPTLSASPAEGSGWAKSRSDSMSGILLSRVTAKEDNLALDKLQLIVKWGGEPTHSARYQAQDLGENLRNDLLLMNREAIDDVSVFSSSERRVTTSGQIFAASFLNQTDLPPDFISVRKDLLDDSNAAKDVMDKVKKKLKTLLRAGHKAPAEFAWPPNMPEPFIVVRSVVELMRFLHGVMNRNYDKIPSEARSSLTAVARGGVATPQSDSATIGRGGALSRQTFITSIQPRWCCGEDPEMFKERWEKLFKEFTDPEKVDPSKVSELYDSMKFDALHNRQWLEWTFSPDSSMLEEESCSTMPSTLSSSSAKTTPKPSQPSSPSEIKFSPPTLAPDKAPEKATIGQRIGFRRRSEIAPPPPKPPTVDYPLESYFTLFTGIGSGQRKPSTAKMDAKLEKLRELYKLCKVLFDYIGPQEYGIDSSEKLEIGLLTSLPLLREIVTDLEEVQASEGAKSFFYFTKESHIYTLLNCILEGDIKTKIERNAIPELDYLSQICFELYESQNATSDDEPNSFNYSIRITLSPGCHTFDPLDVQLDSKHCIGFAPRRSLTAHHDWQEILDTLREKFHTVKLPKSFVAVNLSEKLPQAFEELTPETEKDQGLEVPNGNGKDIATDVSSSMDD